MVTLICPARRFISAAAAKAYQPAPAPSRKLFAILRLHAAHRALDPRKRLRQVGACEP